MGFWGLFGSILGVLGKFLDWLYAKEVAKGQRLQDELDAIRKQRDEEAKANAAREGVRADIAANDGRLPVNDPFRRD